MINGRESDILTGTRDPVSCVYHWMVEEGRKNQIHVQGRVFLSVKKENGWEVSYSYPCGSTVLVMVIESRVGIGNMNIGYGMDLLVLMFIWVAPGLIPWVGSIG